MVFNGLKVGTYWKFLSTLSYVWGRFFSKFLPGVGRNGNLKSETTMNGMIDFIFMPAWAGPILMGNFSQTLTWNHKVEEQYFQGPPDIGKTPDNPSLHTASQEADGRWGRELGCVPCSHLARSQKTFQVLAQGTASTMKPWCCIAGESLQKKNMTTQWGLADKRTKENLP